MEHVDEWKVTLHLDEHDGQTRAIVRLHTRDTSLTGIGTAYRNPRDRNIPEIGDELAAARALSDLAHKLLGAAVADIEAVTQRPAAVTL
jgi:uncharacterized protein DUF1876